MERLTAVRTTSSFNALPTALRSMVTITIVCSRHVVWLGVCLVALAGCAVTLLCIVIWICTLWTLSLVLVATAATLEQVYQPHELAGAASAQALEEVKTQQQPPITRPQSHIQEAARIVTQPPDDDIQHHAPAMGPVIEPVDQSDREIEEALAAWDEETAAFEQNAELGQEAQVHDAAVTDQHEVEAGQGEPETDTGATFRFWPNAAEGKNLGAVLAPAAVEQVEVALPYDEPAPKYRVAESIGKEDVQDVAQVAKSILPDVLAPTTQVSLTSGEWLPPLKGTADALAAARSLLTDAVNSQQDRRSTGTRRSRPQTQHVVRPAKPKDFAALLPKPQTTVPPRSQRIAVTQYNDENLPPHKRRQRAARDKSSSMGNSMAPVDGSMNVAKGTAVLAAASKNLYDVLTVEAAADEEPTGLDPIAHSPQDVEARSWNPAELPQPRPAFPEIEVPHERQNVQHTGDMAESSGHLDAERSGLKEAPPLTRLAARALSIDALKAFNKAPQPREHLARPQSDEVRDATSAVVDDAHDMQCTACGRWSNPQCWQQGEELDWVCGPCRAVGSDLNAAERVVSGRSTSTALDTIPPVCARCSDTGHRSANCTSESALPHEHELPLATIATARTSDPAAVVAPSEATVSVSEQPKAPLTSIATPDSISLQAAAPTRHRTLSTGSPERKAALIQAVDVLNHQAHRKRESLTQLNRALSREASPLRKQQKKTLGYEPADLLDLSFDDDDGWTSPPLAPVNAAQRRKTGLSPRVVPFFSSATTDSPLARESTVANQIALQDTGLNATAKKDYDHNSSPPYDAHSQAYDWTGGFTQQYEAPPGLSLPSYLTPSYNYGHQGLYHHTPRRYYEVPHGLNTGSQQPAHEQYAVSPPLMTIQPPTPITNRFDVHAHYPQPQISNNFGLTHDNMVQAPLPVSAPPHAGQRSSSAVSITTPTYDTHTTQSVGLPSAPSTRTRPVGVPDVSSNELFPSLSAAQPLKALASAVQHHATPGPQQSKVEATPQTSRTYRRSEGLQDHDKHRMDEIQRHIQHNPDFAATKAGLLAFKATLDKEQITSGAAQTVEPEKKKVSPASDSEPKRTVKILRITPVRSTQEVDDQQNVVVDQQSANTGIDSGADTAVLHVDQDDDLYSTSRPVSPALDSNQETTQLMPPCESRMPGSQVAVASDIDAHDQGSDASSTSADHTPQDLLELDNSLDVSSTKHRPVSPSASQRVNGNQHQADGHTDMAGDVKAENDSLSSTRAALKKQKRIARSDLGTVWWAREDARRLISGTWTLEREKEFETATKAYNKQRTLLKELMVESELNAEDARVFPELSVKDRRAPKERPPPPATATKTLEASTPRSPASEDVTLQAGEEMQQLRDGLLLQAKKALDLRSDAAAYFRGHRPQGRADDTSLITKGKGKFERARAYYRKRRDLLEVAFTGDAALDDEVPDDDELEVPCMDPGHCTCRRPH